MNKRVFASSLILCCLLQVSFTQKIHFQKYSLFEGLPDATVYSILEDSRGFLWIGTEGGLARTDGVRFEVFNTTNGLSGDAIRAIYEDQKKRIWIGTNRGLDCFDGNTFQAFGENTGLENALVQSIKEDTTGKLLIGTDDLGLFMVEMDADTTVSSISQKEGLTVDFIWDIEVDVYNRYWLSLFGGINVLSFTDSRVEIISFIEGLHLPGDVITCSDQDPSGNMWFGTMNRGMFKIINEENLSPRMALIPQILDFLKDETVWDIYWADSSTCWIATQNYGLLKYQDGTVAHSISSQYGLPTNQIYRILEDKDNSLWLATLGSGILRYEGESFKKYGLNQSRTGIDVLGMIEADENHLIVATDEGLYDVSLNLGGDYKVAKKNLTVIPPNNTITSIAMDQTGTIWLGTSQGLYELVGKEATYSKYNKDLSSTRISSLFTDHKNRLWVGTGNGYNLCSGSEVLYLTEENGLIHNEIQTIYQDRKRNIWIGTLGGLVKISDKYRDFNEEEGLTDLQVNSLIEEPDGDLLIGTFGGGIYRLNPASNEIEIKQVPGNNKLSSRNIHSLLWENPNTLIAVTELGFDKIFFIQDSIAHVVHYDAEDGYCEGSNNTNAMCRTSDGLIWFGTLNSLVSYNQKLDFKSSIVPLAYISDLRINQQKVDWTQNYKTTQWFHLPKNLELAQQQNHLTFDFTCIHFSNPGDVEFTYLLEGLSSSWAPYSTKRSVTFQGLSPGEYKFRLKAKSKFNLESEEAAFSFRITPPFWMTAWFLICCSVLLILFILIIVRLRVRKLQKEKAKLQNLVELRTWEITQQKEQIEEQRDVLFSQQEQITDSMEYGNYIQQAILPGTQLLDECAKEFFVLLLPQHIVSGDFYWVGKHDSHIVFTASDCTGHGVPGAFMSMLGISFLNKIVTEKGIVRPAEILNALRANILRTFDQNNESRHRSKDGIDMALCSFDLENKKLYYAGAMNSIYQLSQSEGKYKIVEHIPDKMPVGNYSIMKDFSENEIKINAGDTLYLFSDGFSDQFGGEKGKKFMKSRFKNMLISHQKLPMAEQKLKFQEILENWIDTNPKKVSDYPQTDDVLLMGLKF